MSDYLASLDQELWNETEEPETEDILDAAMQSLKALSAEFQGLGSKLDGQSEQSAAMLKIMQTMAGTMTAVLAAQSAQEQAIRALSKTLSAPRRIIKDKDGKPVGVEISGS